MCSTTQYTSGPHFGAYFHAKTLGVILLVHNIYQPTIDNIRGSFCRIQHFSWIENSVHLKEFQPTGKKVCISREHGNTIGLPKVSHTTHLLTLVTITSEVGTFKLERKCIHAKLTRDIINLTKYSCTSKHTKLDIKVKSCT